MTLSSDASCEGLAAHVTGQETPDLDSSLEDLQTSHQAALTERSPDSPALRRNRRPCSAMAQAHPAQVSAGLRGPKPAGETVSAQELACGLVGQFQAGGKAKSTAVARILQLTFADRSSSRAAQIALSVLPSGAAEELVVGLHGHIRDASFATYAHHVVQRIIQVMPASGSPLVALELLGVGDKVAQDRFGCRVICSLLQNGFPNEKLVKLLMDEVITEAASLCEHQFGSRVLWHTLKFGVPRHRHMVVRALRANTLANAADKQGSRLVEAALNFASPLDKHIIASDVLEHGEALIRLSGNRFGCRVVICILKMLEFQRRAVGMLLPAAARLRDGTKYSKRVLEIVEGSFQ